MQRLLGLFTFCRRFVAGASRLTAPLTALLKKDAAWAWSQQQEQGFQGIKEALASAPVLVTPDLARPFVLRTDASLAGIGGVLLQDQGQGPQPVAYESRSLTAAERNYPVHELEELAIVHCLLKFRFYVLGQHTDVYTDHHSLQYFFSERRNLSGRQARWVEQLSPFDFTIHYRRGETNAAADALSRREEGAGSGIDDRASARHPARPLEAAAARLEPDPGPAEDIRAAYKSDATTRRLVEVARGGGSTRYHLAGCLLLDAKERIYVP
ncbi:Ty3/Gypsy family RNase HI domain-containing protein, partial [Paenibacillus sp. GCM10012307]|uniref:Ty3/Gypsy family RNase HI domain-containing protein n=1 Tax=Paenibacillus sp. GCM10012307 TaxID=3317343 RepID=UPI003609B576